MQYDLNGNLIFEYNSVKEASGKTKIYAQNISHCCKQIRNCAGGYIWKYKLDSTVLSKINTDFISKMIHHGNTPRAVIQMNMMGEKLNKFNSIKDAMKITGCHKSKIVEVCKGRRIHTKGYKWKYEKI